MLAPWLEPAVPEVKKDLLVMIGSFDKAKVVLECRYVAQEPLGVSGAV